jgi:hypothetical protein
MLASYIVLSCTDAIGLEGPLSINVIHHVMPDCAVLPFTYKPKQGEANVRKFGR